MPLWVDYGRMQVHNPGPNYFGQMAGHFLVKIAEKILFAMLILVST